MKCPKYKAAAIASGHAQNDADIECNQAECAWWDKPNGVCSIRSIADSLSDIYTALVEMHNAIKGCWPK